MNGPNSKLKADQSANLAEKIKTAILKGEFQPGQRLVESQLCMQYKSNRYRVRDAIQKLEHVGFVILTPNVGATVAALTRGTMENTFEIASVLDGLAIRLATPFLTPIDIEKLAELVQKLETCQKLATCTRYNGEFHAFFADRCENPNLLQLIELTRDKIRSFGHYTFSITGQLDESRRWHRQIFEAVKDKKAHQAEQLMRDHIIDSMNRLLIYLQKHDV